MKPISVTSKKPEQTRRELEKGITLALPGTFQHDEKRDCSVMISILAKGATAAPNLVVLSRIAPSKKFQLFNIRGNNVHLEFRVNSEAKIPPIPPLTITVVDSTANRAVPTRTQTSHDSLFAHEPLTHSSHDERPSNSSTKTAKTIPSHGSRSTISTNQASPVIIRSHLSTTPTDTPINFVPEQKPPIAPILDFPSRSVYSADANPKDDFMARFGAKLEIPSQPEPPVSATPKPGQARKYSPSKYSGARRLIFQPKPLPPSTQQRAAENDTKICLLSDPISENKKNLQTSKNGKLMEDAPNIFSFHGTRISGHQRPSAWKPRRASSSAATTSTHTSECPCSEFHSGDTITSAAKTSSFETTALAEGTFRKPLDICGCGVSFLFVSALQLLHCCDLVWTCGRGFTAQCMSQFVKGNMDIESFLKRLEVRWSTPLHLFDHPVAFLERFFAELEKEGDGSIVNQMEFTSSTIRQCSGCKTTQTLLPRTQPLHIVDVPSFYDSFRENLVARVERNDLKFRCITTCKCLEEIQSTSQTQREDFRILPKFAFFHPQNVTNDAKLCSIEPQIKLRDCFGQEELYHLLGTCGISPNGQFMFLRHEKVWFECTPTRVRVISAKDVFRALHVPSQILLVLYEKEVPQKLW